MEILFLHINIALNVFFLVPLLDHKNNAVALSPYWGIVSGNIIKVKNISS